jgi:hypothetical protein
LYELAALNAQNDTIVECAAGCEVRVNGRATFLDRARFRPKTGVTGLGVGNVHLLIKGSNGASGPLGQPPACSFGNDSEARAYIFAPNGTLRLGDRIVQRGKLVAKDVWLGQDADSQGQQLPLVTAGPEDVTVNVGQLAQFEVVASGTGLSYQWQRDGVNVQGATGAVHTIPSAALADNGKQFRVIVSNSAGSVTSGSATLTVTNCAATDTTCDGQDDDCNGTPDDGYVPVCVGSASRMVCVDGDEEEQPCGASEECAGGECVPAGTGGTGGGGSGGNSGSGGASGGGTGGGGPGPGTSFEFVIKLPNGVQRSEVTVGATGGEVLLQDHAKVLTDTGYGSVSSVDGVAGVHLEDHTNVRDVWTEGAATLDYGVTVHGDLFSDGLTLGQASVIVGTTDDNADLQPLEVIRWEVFFPDQTQGPAVLATNETRALSPGAYDDVSVPGGAVLQLGAGTYTMESLNVGFGGTISADNTEGPVFVYVKGGLSYSGSVVRAEARANVMFGVAGADVVFLNTRFTGILVAPNAEVVIKKPFVGEHRGSFFARDVVLKEFATVRGEPLDEAELCDAAEGDCSGLCRCADGEGTCESDDECLSGECDESVELCVCVEDCPCTGDPHCALRERLFFSVKTPTDVPFGELALVADGQLAVGPTTQVVSDSGSGLSRSVASMARVTSRS